MLVDLMGEGKLGMLMDIALKVADGFLGSGLEEILGGLDMVYRLLGRGERGQGKASFQLSLCIVLKEVFW